MTELQSLTNDVEAEAARRNGEVIVAVVTILDKNSHLCEWGKLASKLRQLNKRRNRLFDRGYGTVGQLGPQDLSEEIAALDKQCSELDFIIEVKAPCHNCSACLSYLPKPASDYPW
jgi:hypothetical protein